MKATPKAEVHVAVAVLYREGRVLVARRPRHVHQGGLLEFPGGKVEPGETVQQALAREIAEETGLAVPIDTLRPVIGIRHDYGDKQVFLDVWKTDAATGSPEGKEGQEVRWMALEELKDSDFPEANRPIIRALCLPHRYAITGPFQEVAEGLSRLKRSLEASRPPMVLLRAPGLDRGDYLEFARAALALCRAHGVSAMLHGSTGLEAQLSGAVGCHLPWREARELADRPIRQGQWFSVSCHGSAEVSHAAAIGADFVTLGPVKPTGSHPGAEVLGWPEFQRIVDRAPVPVYALGGLAAGDEGVACEHGAQGAAGIGFWWRQDKG